MLTPRLLLRLAHPVCRFLYERGQVILGGGVPLRYAGILRPFAATKSPALLDHAPGSSFLDVDPDSPSTGVTIDDECTVAGRLGHATGSVTSGYVHLDTALVSAADRIASVIAGALDGKPAAQVVSMGKTARGPGSDRSVS
jgi:hypothetical protein